MTRRDVQRGQELLEAIAASLAGNRYRIPACVGMTRYRACRGAKPLCIVFSSPKSGGRRGLTAVSRLPRLLLAGRGEWLAMTVWMGVPETIIRILEAKAAGFALLYPPCACRILTWQARMLTQRSLHAAA